MGRIAFWITYLFYTLPADSKDDRRHIHIFKDKKNIFRVWQKFRLNKMKLKVFPLRITMESH